MGESNVLDAACDCYVLDCGGGVAAKSITVGARITGEGAQIRFANAAGEVHADRLVLNGGGELKAFVLNQWHEGALDGGDGGARYSLIAHAKELEINDNPAAIAALAQLVGAAQPGHDGWGRCEVPRALWVLIEGTEGAEERHLDEISEYFDYVRVNGEHRTDKVEILQKIARSQEEEMDWLTRENERLDAETREKEEQYKEACGELQELERQIREVEGEIARLMETMEKNNDQ